MAKLTKTQDTANWRKGKDLMVGDTVEMRKIVNGTISYEKSMQVVGSIEMERKQYRVTSEDGLWTRLIAGNEFAAGRY